MFQDASNPDIWRGIDQLQITGFFYAGLGYSIAAMVTHSAWLSERAKEFLKRDSEMTDSSRFEEN
jgi:hypothetical protein